jgi:hypothetical protein
MIGHIYLDVGDLDQGGSAEWEEVDRVWNIKKKIFAK